MLRSLLGRLYFLCLETWLDRWPFYLGWWLCMTVVSIFQHLFAEEFWARILALVIAHPIFMLIRWWGSRKRA